MTQYRKKLIEVALPLEAINKESAREKSIRHGHPSTLHLWWARRPLATCRAVLFASLVDDPSSLPEQFPTEESQEVERQRLFRIIEELVKWDNVSGGDRASDPEIVAKARAEILRSTGGNPPPVLDPFCGGGSIPLEAQRLGLAAYASDLNPVAVLITKALIEIPPKFAGRPAVHPHDGQQKFARTWKGVQGLAEDVRYYGQWMRDAAFQRVGHLYPTVGLPGGGKATVIAWLWARTVVCPNPACGAHMPLVRSFFLALRKHISYWVEPMVDRSVSPPTVRFVVQSGTISPVSRDSARSGTGIINDKGKGTKAVFKCICCNQGIAKGEYIDQEANAGRMQSIPLALVAESSRGRIYLDFDQDQSKDLYAQAISLLSQGEIADRVPRESSRGTFASNAQGRIYGFRTFADYFTPRQLVSLTTLCNLIGEVREKVLSDASTASMPDDGVPLHAGGTGASAYADGIATYLAFVVDRATDYNSTLCGWNYLREGIRNVFARQGITMSWDYAEVNMFSDSAGNIVSQLDWVARCIDILGMPTPSFAYQADALELSTKRKGLMISTDPPYYGNVGYADLSDFFYVWLRRSLWTIYPNLFSTMLVPKVEELVAVPHRFDGNREKASEFFEDGIRRSFSRMREIQSDEFPLTIYYAVKQSESEDGDTEGNNLVVASTGWETMLDGLLKAGFSITATWPMRTERSARTVGIGTNALASSIILVCRPRPADAPVTTRREFRANLKRELPGALLNLQHGNIAPVDLAQASIGPGMAVYSRYSLVLEVDGSAMRVRTALQLINQALDEVVAEQDSDYDADTRWAVAWYEQFGMAAAPYGTAETLSRAKNTSVAGLVEAGLLRAAAGKVQLLGRKDLPEDWNPARDRRLTVWETTQHLARALEQHGEVGAARLLGELGTAGAAARDLAYRLYLLCERKGWADEALAYNALVVAWPELMRLAAEQGGADQMALSFDS